MKRFRFGWIGLLAGLWVGWGQGDAFAQKIYWTDVLNGKIQSANLDGTGVTTVFDAVSVLPAGFTHPARPAFLVVDPKGGWIYWTDLWSGVHRVRLDGTGYQNIVPITPVTIPQHTFPPDRTTTILERPDAQGIALDPVRNLLYWGPDHPFESPLGSPYMNPPAEGGHVRMSNPDGTAVVDIHNTGIDGYTSALALDMTRGKMYFSSPTSNYYPTGNNLYRANLDGSNKEIFYHGNGNCDPRDIKVDEAAGKVYWNCFWAGAVMQQNVDGTGNKILASVSGPGGIALDLGAGMIYVLESDAGTVTRRNLLDGTLDAVLVTEATANPQPRQNCGTDAAPDPCPFYPQGIALDLTVPPNPDMIVSGLTTSATTVALGADITVTDTTKNQGTASAGASATLIYLSNDATLDGADRQIGGRPVEPLIAGSSNSGTTTVTIPSNTPAGTRYLIVVADGGKAFPELNENNNTWTKSITVAAPDFIVSALSAPTRASVGSTITIKDTTKNQGTFAAIASTTTYYLSTDAFYDGGDLVIGSHTVPTLSSGASYNGFASYTIPQSTVRQTYYIIARADAGLAAAETNETNNTRAFKITVK